MIEKYNKIAHKLHNTLHTKFIKLERQMNSMDKVKLANKHK